MPALNPTCKATVADFARGMGLSPRENDDGSFGFDFEDSGRLSILSDDTGARVLVTLTRRVILDDLIPLARLASASGHDAANDLMLQGGLNRAGQPVLTAALDIRAFDLPRLDRTFHSLRDAFRSRGL